MLPRWLKSGLKAVTAGALRPLQSRLGRHLPPLTADEWAACQYTFAQFGEDRLVLTLLGADETAAGTIYVDVGAHDPVRLSNTLLLHKFGWVGVNVDANEEAIVRFRQARPGDRNVWAAVSDSQRDVAYYRYPSPAANRIGPPDESDPRNVLGESPLSVTRMCTVPLNDLLAEHVRPGERIGFLNIDCEGEDLTLLRHLDWDRWRPTVVAVEAHGAETVERTVEVLTANGYECVGKMLVTLVFRQRAPGGSSEGAL